MTCCFFSLRCCLHLSDKCSFPSPLLLLGDIWDCKYIVWLCSGNRNLQRRPGEGSTGACLCIMLCWGIYCLHLLVNPMLIATFWFVPGLYMLSVQQCYNVNVLLSREKGLDHTHLHSKLLQALISGITYWGIICGT